MKIHHFISIAWLEPFWLLLPGVGILLPGKLLPLAWHPYVVVALFIFAPFRWSYYAGNTRSNVSPDQQRHTLFLGWFSDHPLALPTTVLVLCLAIGLWASADRTTSWITLGYILLGIALFRTLRLWPPVQSEPTCCALALLLIGGGLAIVSPPIIEWKPQFRLFYLPLYDQLQTYRLNIGETIHANVLAGVLVLVLPLFFALVLQPNWAYRRWLWLLCLAMTLVTLAILLLTQSRGGYLAAGVVLPLVLTLRWPRLAYLTPFVLLAAFMAVQFIGLPTLLDQFSSDSSLGGWDGRLDIWLNSLQAISDFSFTGIGIGTFTLVMPLLYPLQVSIEGYPHAHNLFLQIALDLGLPGLIAYLAIIINLFVMLIATLRSKYTTPLHRALAIGCTGSLVGMLVHGLLDAVTWGTKLAFVPWILFALITQLFLHTQAAQRNAST